VTENYNGFYKTLEYHKRTGLCAVCGKKKAAASHLRPDEMRMTCGHIACMERWLGMKTIASNKDSVRVELEPSEIEWALAVAEARCAAKRNVPVRDKRHKNQWTGESRHDNFETHRIGVLGELAAAKVLDTQISTSYGPTGKYMPDLVINGFEIEVKTLQGYLVFRSESEFARGVAVLVTHNKGENLVVQGWIDAPTFRKKMFTDNFGYGDRPCVHPQDLFPIQTLRPWLENLGQHP
jgi:hypothetical protein